MIGPIFLQLTGISKKGSQHFRFHCLLGAFEKGANPFTQKLGGYVRDPHGFCIQLGRATDGVTPNHAGLQTLGRSMMTTPRLVLPRRKICCKMMCTSRNCCKPVRVLAALQLNAELGYLNALELHKNWLCHYLLNYVWHSMTLCACACVCVCVCVCVMYM